jgi:hypothetical protein
MARYGFSEQAPLPFVALGIGIGFGLWLSLIFVTRHPIAVEIARLAPFARGLFKATDG